MVAELGGTCTGIEKNFPLVDKDECMKASTSLNTNWKGEEEEVFLNRAEIIRKMEFKKGFFKILLLLKVSIF